MKDFSLCFEGQWRQGQLPLKVKRGRVVVHDDVLSRVYKVKRGELAEFKRWWLTVDNNRLTGSYPHYTR